MVLLFKKKNKEDGRMTELAVIFGAYAFVLLAVVAVSIFIGGWAVRYTVQFWGSYFKGTPVHVPFLPCAIAGLFIGSIAIPVAVATWVLSYVL